MYFSPAYAFQLRNAKYSFREKFRGNQYVLRNTTVKRKKE